MLYNEQSAPNGEKIVNQRSKRHTSGIFDLEGNT